MDRLGEFDTSERYKEFSVKALGNQKLNMKKLNIKKLNIKKLNIMKLFAGGTLLLLLAGCGRNSEEAASEIPDAEKLLDAFLAGEIPAIRDSEEEFMFDQLPFEEEDWYSYSVGERIDLDNDGENEQILDGPYGGIYLDARDGKVYVLAEGDGTASVLFYTNYDNATWIVHCDITHVGRQTFWMTRYDGEGNIADEFRLEAQYWDSPDGTYDENSDFTYREEKITMREYEALRKEILGW